MGGDQSETWGMIVMYELSLQHVIMYYIIHALVTEHLVISLITITEILLMQLGTALR